MDTFELKKEQQRLSGKVILRDDFAKIKLIGGVDCVALGNKLLACIVVCEYPSMKLVEKKTYSLSDPSPYLPGYLSYRVLPAIMEAYNLLDEEPDLLLVAGAGIAHPRKFGLASHLGLSLNKPTIGITQKAFAGQVEKGKIIFQNEIVGFEVRTREYANPLYASPGHLISLGSVISIIPSTIQYPHKMPEPLHLAHKIGKKKVKGCLLESKE
jgi:deoxyribonuclease V